MKIWFPAFLTGDGSHHFERWQAKNEAEESLTQKHNGRLRTYKTEKNNMNGQYYDNKTTTTGSLEDYGL